MFFFRPQRKDADLFTAAFYEVRAFGKGHARTELFRLYECCVELKYEKLLTSCMKRILTLLIVLAALTALPLVAADNHSTCSEDAQSVCATLEELGVESGASVPFIVPSNAVINLSFSNATHIGYVEVANGVVVEVRCCEQPAQATHTATVTSLAVVEAIRDSEKPLKEAQARLSSGELTLEAASFGNSMRIVAARVLLRVASWF